MLFTEKLIKSLQPQEGKKCIDIRENSGKGFGVTVFASGKKSFIFIYHFHGRKRRMTLGQYPQCTLALARQRHREALSLLENDIDPALEKQKDKKDMRDSATVAALIEEYIEKWAKPRKRSWKEDQRILKKDVEPLWRNTKAKAITRRDINLLLDKIKERGAPIAANRTLACIRRMFNFAVERDIIPMSPCQQIKAPSKENQRDRCLTLDEVKILWSSLSTPHAEANSSDNAIKLSPRCKLALKLQLVTAQRKGEIISAEWRELDTSARWWTIPAEKTKNGRPHRVYLSDLAIELLNEIKSLSGDSKWLFPSPAEDKDSHISPKALSRGVNRSTTNDINHWTPHDLRRTAATHMTGLGVSRLVVSKILNHTESSVTAIYDRHSYDDEKRQALELWGKKIESNTKCPKPKNNVTHLKQAI